MDKIKISTVIDLIKNKNKTGFDLLYQNHYKFLFSIAFSITKNEADSQDVVQNVFYKLVKMPSEKFPNSGESSWLYRVVKNETLNYIKSKKEVYSLDESLEIPTFDKDISDFCDMDSYYSLIENLNETQKEVVTLKVLGDLSHKEIGKILDKPIGTIQWIYNTSIKKLRISLVSMASVALIFVLGVTSRIFTLTRGITGGEVSTTMPSHDPPPQGAPPQDAPMQDAPIIVEETNLLQDIFTDEIFLTLSVGVILVLVGILLFLKFSYKLPTNGKK